MTKLLNRRELSAYLAAAVMVQHAGLSYAARPKPRIKGIARRDDTIVRHDIYGAVFEMTWVSDDLQIVSICEAMDLSDPPQFTAHGLAVAATGSPANVSFRKLPSYPPTPWRKKGPEAHFWGGSCLAVDGVVYQILSTPNHPYLREDGSFWPDLRSLGSKIIYSMDKGATWRNQNGSSPVTWERWDGRSAANMLFYSDQPGEFLPGGTFLQMGRNYEQNADGYVYMYCDNTTDAGGSDQLVVMRVDKKNIMKRAAWEFFEGVGADGVARWTKDVNRRGVAHTFPAGWSTKGKVIDGQAKAGWSFNVVYNQPLDAYMMVAQGTGFSDTGSWFGKPSYLGFWIADTPWGPFRQVHEETAWTPNNDPEARTMHPRLSPMWISTAGTSVWMTYSDYQFKGASGESEHPDKSFVETSRAIVDDAKLAQFLKTWSNVHMPYTRLNMQRIDLLVE